ncbi:MAG: NAD(+)/NADH kinase [Oscillospiraceae bacterium]
MKIFVLPNLDKQNCKEYTTSACMLLNNYKAELFMSKKYNEPFKELTFVNFVENSKASECDVIVVIGGDGTILECANFSSVFHKPILGINCGHLGFMASLEYNELDKLSKLCRGEYTVSRRMMLSIDIQPRNNDSMHFTALNDVVISKCDDCKIADFRVYKNKSTIATIRADGIILSTPTGATAYSMSAGGPIIEPDMECIEFTQICPHTMFSRSVVLSPDSIVTVKTSTAKGEHTGVFVDGNMVYKLANKDVVTVAKSDLHTDIIDINGNSFFSSVNDKLMHPLKEITED